MTFPRSLAQLLPRLRVYPVRLAGPGGNKALPATAVQWSCHVQTQRDGLAHYEFLDDSGSDPRRRFAQALLAACGDAGPSIVNNQDFERRVVWELLSQYCLGLLNGFALNQGPLHQLR